MAVGDWRILTLDEGVLLDEDGNVETFIWSREEDEEGVVDEVEEVAAATAETDGEGGVGLDVLVIVEDVGETFNVE